MNRSTLRNELVRDEGVRLTAYQDTNGFWTVGVGHLLGEERRMFSITTQEADALLDYDVTLAEVRVIRLVGSIAYNGLDDVRQRALVNMAFNRGGNMDTSTTITPAIKIAVLSDSAADWAKVAAAILASPWAKQIGDRAHRLAVMLGKGVAT